MNKYSVLLLYPDFMNDSGCESYYAHVEAENQHLAVAKACDDCQKSNGWVEGDEDWNFPVLLVLEGWHDAK